jgi:hypothetical protein
MLLTALNVTWHSAPDDRANYVSWLSALFHPLLNNIFFDSDSSWVVECIVCANNLKEATITLSLLISSYDTVNG